MAEKTRNNAKSDDQHDVAVTPGSGNVFADMGLPEPEERLLKARLASLIFDLIRSRGWTQRHAAEVLGITQPDVSNLVNGRLKNFSVERLLHFLSRLEQRVTITVSSDELPTQEIVLADWEESDRREPRSRS